MSRVWGRHAPTRSHRKCRRIEEVKSRWNTTFSRIENLWPRDGSCPLPLRSKPFLGNCFRIVKAQKISRGCAAHVCGSPFAPNAVPAPVCAAALSGSPTESVRSWRSISFRRLMKDSRYSMKKAGRSADTTFCFFQIVRRVVVLGIARNRLNIRFGHCTSCLFDNSSVKLCKHDTPFVRAIRREL